MLILFILARPFFHVNVRTIDIYYDSVFNIVGREFSKLDKYDDIIGKLGGTLSDDALHSKALAQSGLTQAVYDYVASLGVTSAAEMTFTQKLKMSAIALKEQAAAFWASPLGKAAVIGAAIFAIVKIINAVKQSIEEVRQEAIESADAAAQLSDEISTLTLKYASLSEAVKTDESAKESLISTQSELIEKLGLEQYEIDQLIEKYGSLSEAILKASKDDLQMAEIDLRKGLDTRTTELLEAVGSAMKDAQTYSNNYISMPGIGAFTEGLGLFPTDEDYAELEKFKNDTQAAFEALKEAGMLGAEAMKNGKGDYLLDLNFDLNSVDGIIDAHARLGEMLRLVDDEAGQNNAIFSELNAQYERLDAAVNNYTDSVGELNKNLANQYILDGLINAGEVPDTQEEFDAYRQSVIDAAIASGEFVGSTEQISSAIDGVLRSDVSFAQFYDDVADSASDAATEAEDATSTINEAIDAVQSKLSTLSGALTRLQEGSLGINDVIDLLQQFPELATYVDLTADGFGDLEQGLRDLIKASPDDLIESLQKFKETKDLTEEQKNQIDNLCVALSNLPTDAIRDVSGEFGVLAESINNAKQAQNELEAALAEDDWDTGYEGRVSAFGGFQEVLDAGEYGSKAYAAYKEYFGLIEKSPEQIKAWMESNKKYFTEGTDGVLAFLQTVESLSGAGGALDGIASFDAETGEFWYDINELGAFADALGWTEEMLQDFIYKYRMYCEEWESRSPADTMKELTNAGLISQIGYVDFGPTFASLTELREYTGLSEQGVYDLIDSINELRAQEGLPNISLIGRDITEVTQTSITQWQNLGATAEEVSALLIDLANQDVAIAPNLYIDTESGPQIDVDTLLAEAGIDGSETVHIEVDMTVNNEPAMATIEATVAEVEAILGEGWEALLSADTADAETRIQAVQTLLEELPPSTDVLVLDSTGLARSNLSKVIDLLGTIDANKTKTITIRYQTIGMPMFAEGTSGAKAGPALLGDEYSPNGSPKPELVVSGNRAYLAGQSGPEIGYLNDGDIVYTADETKRILRGNILHKSIPAHAGGTGSGLFDNGSIGGYQNYNYSGNTSSSSSSSSSSKSKSSSDEEESWFEKQYKYHQHLLAMDQESVAAYLDWLDDAYKKAYKEGVIDLDEYYKYQEEVYQGIQDLFKDHLSDIDHEISMLEGAVGSSDEVIALAQKAMADIEKELAAARAAGLDENNDYIQYLEQQWKGYSETVTDLREQAETDAENAVDNLVDYRIKMLKQDIQNEKDALNKKLDYLSDFYSKQREMLQDQYDEEKYLEEQSEKRKSVSDIQSELDMLKYDDSAWAQKRKLELQEELTTAQKDLADFEKEYALDNTLDLLEEQQKAQEAQIQAEMEALDAKLNDPEALFNQALSDIKNNTEQLYQEFLEYNRKYGTGNDEDVEEMWEEAYKADQEYQDTHNGESKDGIEIGNYTGYTAPEPATPPTSSTSTPSTTTPSTSTTTSAPSLTTGSYVEVKSGTKWYADSYGGGSWGRAKAGTIKYINTKGSHPYNIDGLGWVKKSDIVGYATGTDNATPGWHELFEGNEDEYIFTSGDGSKYRMFSGLGDKVLNPGATDFLYDFATTGGEFLSNMFSELMKLVGLDKLSKPTQLVQLSTGDIIVQGNADKQTVSEIRRMQRSETDRLLKEFNRLNK